MHSRPGACLVGGFFVLQWPLGEQQLFAPGHMKYSSHEIQPPHTRVASISIESSELAKARRTALNQSYSLSEPSGNRPFYDPQSGSAGCGVSRYSAGLQFPLFFGYAILRTGCKDAPTAPANHVVLWRANPSEHSRLESRFLSSPTFIPPNPATRVMHRPRGFDRDRDYRYTAVSVSLKAAHPK